MEKIENKPTPPPLTNGGISINSPYFKYQEMVSRSWRDCPDTPSASNEPLEGDVLVTPIKKVLALVHPNAGLEKSTALIINDMLMLLLSKLGKEAGDLLNHKLTAVEHMDCINVPDGCDSAEYYDIIAKRSFPTEAFLIALKKDEDEFWLCASTALASKDKALFEAFNNLTADKRTTIYQEHVVKCEGETGEEYTPFCIDSRSVQSAVRLIFPGEIAKHAVSEGTKAVTKFFSNDEVASPTSWTRNAGLCFPTSVHGYYLGRFTGRSVTPSASVYLAAVLEYISAELLELSGNSARQNRSSSIYPRDLVRAVKGDEELNDMFSSSVTFAGIEDTFDVPYGRLRSSASLKPDGEDVEEGDITDLSKIMSLDHAQDSLYSSYVETGNLHMFRSYGSLEERSEDGTSDDLVDLFPADSSTERDISGKRKVHRKVLRDNIWSFDVAGISQIMLRAGVPRWSGLIHEELRNKIRLWLENVMRIAVVYTVHRRRSRYVGAKSCTVVSVEDVQRALMSLSYAPVMGMGKIQKCLDASVAIRNFENPDTLSEKNNREIWLDAAKQEAAALISEAKEAADEDDEEDEKESADKDYVDVDPTLKLASKAQKLLKSKIKERLCAFPLTVVMSMVAEVSQDFKTDLRFEPAVFKMVSIALENYLVSLVSKAYHISNFNGRAYLEPKDINLIRQLWV